MKITVCLSIEDIPMDKYIAKECKKMLAGLSKIHWINYSSQNHGKFIIISRMKFTDQEDPSGGLENQPGGAKFLSTVIQVYTIGNPR